MIFTDFNRRISTLTSELMVFKDFDYYLIDEKVDFGLD